MEQKSGIKSKINYLSIYILISLVLLLIYILAFLGVLDGDNIRGYLLVVGLSAIPIIFTTIVFFICKYTEQKYPKWTKIIANILNLSIIIFHAFCIFFIYCTVYVLSDPLKEYTKIGDYKKALKSYEYQYIWYFPTEIPPNAKNKKMYSSKRSYPATFKFYLEFDINDEYIKQIKETYKDRVLSKQLISTNETILTAFNYFLEQDAHEWTIIPMNNGVYDKYYSCYSGIAIKEPTILYFLYCD